MSKRQIEDQQAHDRDEKIADALGISPDDFSLLEINLIEVDSDAATVAYDVYFLDGSDLEVLSQIDGAKINGFIRVGCIDFDSSDSYYE